MKNRVYKQLKKLWSELETEDLDETGKAVRWLSEKIFRNNGEIIIMPNGMADHIRQILEWWENRNHKKETSESNIANYVFCYEGFNGPVFLIQNHITWSEALAFAENLKSENDATVNIAKVISTIYVNEDEDFEDES